MKHLFTKLFLVIACAMLGVNAWAVEETLASFSNSSNTGWTISGNPSYSNTGGYQLVASTMTITSPSIDFSAYKNINITITCRKYGGPNATQGRISVKLGSTSGTELAAYSPSGTTLASSGALSISPSSNGSLVIYCPGASSSKGCGISQIEIKGTPIATETYTVTFDAGTNGTCSSTNLTEAEPGEGVTLPSCNPNLGYVFNGWTETEGKATIDDGLRAGSTYYPAANTTLYAVYAALYQVTIEDPTNGSLAVTCEGNDVTSGDYYAVGQNINIVATPNTGYKFRNIQVVDNSTHTFTSSNTKVWSMGNEAITIKANFDEIVYHTITWSVNGNTSLLPQSVVEAETVITFPTGLADINGKKFVGWSGNSEASSAGDIITVEQTANSSSTFYAVYATVTPGDEETATLTITDTQTVGYTASLTRTDDLGNNWVSYASIVNQSVNSKLVYYMQINRNSNGYYIGSPDFGKNIKAISAKAWNTSASNREAYLKANTNTKQPSTSDYGTTAIPANSKGVNIDFTINNDAEFSQFYIYSSGAIGFESIAVTYGTPDSYSEYTTTPAAPINVTVGAAGYSTYYNSTFSYEMPDGLTGYVAYVDGEGFHLDAAYETGDVVPAGEGLVFKGASDTYTLYYAETSEDTWASAGMNNLYGLDEDGSTIAPDGAAGSFKFYALAKDPEDGVGFYWKAANGAAFNTAAHKAYLVIPASSASQMRGFSFADLENGSQTGVGDIIDEEDVPLIIHTLQGIKVEKVVKNDFYIVNRKHVRYLKAE